MWPRSAPSVSILEPTTIRLSSGSPAVHLLKDTLPGDRMVAILLSVPTRLPLRARGLYGTVRSHAMQALQRRTILSILNMSEARPGEVGGGSSDARSCVERVGKEQPVAQQARRVALRSGQRGQRRLTCLRLAEVCLQLSEKNTLSFRVRLYLGSEFLDVGLHAPALAFPHFDPGAAGGNVLCIFQ